MSNKTYSMKTQLAKGKKAEKAFMDRYGENCFERTDGRKGDFRIKWSQTKVELKSDFYSGTPNLFMERWSVAPTDAKPGKPGGPWQSLENGTKYYVYWLVESDELYVFDVEGLVAGLDKILASLRAVTVKNQGYSTLGYLLPKATVMAKLAELGYLGNDLAPYLYFSYGGNIQT
jgi:hypothetical protein